MDTQIRNLLPRPVKLMAGRTYTFKEIEELASTKNEAGQDTHLATYASDNRNGGYNIRVVGPDANMFAGEEVPVKTKSGDEHMEKLVKLLWTGPDKDPSSGQLTGRKAALYSFEARPKEVVAKPKFR